MVFMDALRRGFVVCLAARSLWCVLRRWREIPKSSYASLLSRYEMWGVVKVTFIGPHLSSPPGRWLSSSSSVVVAHGSVCVSWLSMVRAC